MKISLKTSLILILMLVLALGMLQAAPTASAVSSAKIGTMAGWNSSPSLPVAFLLEHPIHPIHPIHPMVGWNS